MTEEVTLNGTTGKHQADPLSAFDLPGATTQPKLVPSEWGEWLKDYRSESPVVADGITARRVKAESDETFSSRTYLEMYLKDGYLTAPPVAPRVQRKSADALRRHSGSSDTHPQILARFARHAARVFRMPKALFAMGCVDDALTAKVTSVRLTGEVTHSKSPWSTILCGHAALTHDAPFVCRNISADWRFASNPNIKMQSDTLECNGELSSIKFFASIPVYLSRCVGAGEEPTRVGQFSIMDSAERPDWSREDLDLLVDIGKMASEAMEKELQVTRSRTTQHMQRATNFLARSIDEPDLLKGLDLEQEEKDTEVKTTADGYYYCPRRVKLACSMLRKMLGADSVSLIDLSTYRLPEIPTSGDAKNKESRVTSPVYSSRSGRSRPTSPASPASPAAFTNNGRTPPAWRLHYRSMSSLSHGSEDDGSSFGPYGQPQFVVGDGVQSSDLRLDGPRHRRSVYDWLASRRRSRVTRPSVHRVQPDTPEASEDTDESEGVRAPPTAITNPLELILPPNTSEYVTLPCFSVGPNPQPIFAILATFKDRAVIEEETALFVETVCAIISISILRQQIGKADNAAHLFVHQTQHELRTPLHAILGITDFLRGSVGQAAEDTLAPPDVDLSADGVLESMLEGIRLAGTNLMSMLDDVLDFKESYEMVLQEQRSEDIDLRRFVEQLATDELEMLQLQSRVEAQTHQRSDKSRSPELIVVVDSEIAAQRWRVESQGLRKTLTNLVRNALRFTHSGYVEIKVSLHSQDAQVASDGLPPVSNVSFRVLDTGIGMERSFLQSRLLQPFSKADSFKPGMGLGMSLAAAHVHRMGGQIGVESQLGQGTEVLVTLPLESLGSPQNILSPPPTYAVKTVHYHGFSSRGLARVRSFLQDHLSVHGLKVCPARTADVVVLCDDFFEGPAMEVESKLCAISSPSTRFVIVTGNALAHTRNVPAFKGRSHLYIRPPHGFSTLEKVDQFLSCSAPSCHRCNVAPPIQIPDPHHLKKLSSKFASQTSPGYPSRRRESEPGPLGKPAHQLPSISDSPTENLMDDDEFRVLIVEDNEINMKLISTLVRRLGIKYDEARDGHEAVVKFRAFRPSVVLLDISLPVKDGFAACVEMRAHPVVRQPHIVAITALSSSDDKSRGFRQGMSDWRTKPVSPKVLRQDLEQWRDAWNAGQMGLPPSTPSSASGSDDDGGAELPPPIYAATA